ncbi:LLM class flavin-dependent oxidoreductase [Sphingomonas sp. BT-65]|uniref:LLM class flavin-dependent oxidoreductase n=1 Tax=Sphingomonas sp. BT-65 TaxID=2989821 RepID=UPI002235AECD|nr:LLM class flavin-dependent oxidoreductase [Sphingomonas sp. BT-65]MCW4460234.1 LLM class flavin-dependent oxidoreductase [Sphingomonas sp. BT-65]
MTIKFYWRLDPAAEPQRGEPSARPTSGFLPRDVRTAGLTRYDYYAQVARAAAVTGFDGLFVAYRPESDDSQIVAASVARTAPRLLLVPEFPSTVGSAVYAAKEAVSFQRATHDRLGWALVGNADAEDAARTAEFLHVARGVHGTRPFDHEGEYFSVKGGGFQQPLANVPFPPVYLRGDDEEALERSARLADVHLLADAPFDELRSRIETLERLAIAAGREVAAGVVLTVTARESDEEAADAGGAGIAGSYDSVAERIATLYAAGITHFVLSASPSLEEAYRIGQFVLPRVRAALGGLRTAA